MKSNLIRPATPELALKTAPYLRWQDKQEMDALNPSGPMALVMSVEVSEDPIAFYTPSDEIAGFAGIAKEDDISGVVWMLCTPAVETIPLLFCKEAKKWLNSQTGYQILHNIADPRNTLHMKLLKHLGFKRLCYKSAGPRGLTFVEFARIQPCVFP